jgi:hypothetical protein
MISFHDNADARPARDGEGLCATAQKRDLDLYLARLFLPLGRNVIAVGDASGENLAWLRTAYGDATFVIVPRQTVIDRIARRFARCLSDEAIYALDRRTPALSARCVATRGQARAFSIAAAILVAVAWAQPEAIVTALVVLMALLFALSVFFRALLAFRGASPIPAQPAAEGDALPVYTILVPLYREAAVLPALARALMALDYPGMLAQRVKPESGLPATLAQCRGTEPT